jgi:GT2 family glycosyltransferase
VVVATRNRRAELNRSLSHHEDPVVVVDNASTDGSADLVAERYPAAVLVRCDTNLGACARNVGAARALTPYVAFADDDSWWAPGATTAGARLFDAHPRLGVVVARVLVGEQQRPDGFNEVLAGSPLPAPPGLPGTAVLGFLACAAMVRLEAFEAVGGFDRLIHFGGEEAILALDLAEAGWAIQYVPELVVHHHPSTVRPSAAAQYRRGIRNRLLTHVMRRSWPRVARRLGSDLADLPQGPAGVLCAVPKLPAALRRRSTVSSDLEWRLRLLEDQVAPPDNSASVAGVRANSTTRKGDS